jgi:hypothetical protein
MTTFTHRRYFERFSLSVAQYGEILVAQAFGGEKRGDGQPCYDVAVGRNQSRRGVVHCCERTDWCTPRARGGRHQPPSHSRFRGTHRLAPADAVLVILDANE